MSVDLRVERRRIKARFPLLKDRIQADFPSPELEPSQGPADGLTATGSEQSPSQGFGV